VKLKAVKKKKERVKLKPIGTREDLVDVIYNISPPFAVYPLKFHEWQTKAFK